MKKFLVFPALLAAVALFGAGAAPAATGDVVHSVTFSQPCQNGLGVGIAYDGINLWYSCHGSNPDLHRANPLTGLVTASYNIAGGLGALSYDATRNVIWAGEGGGATGPSGPVWQITLDAAKSVTGAAFAFSTGLSCGLDDGLAFDANGLGALDDVIYYSDDCFATTIRSFNLTGGLVESFPTCATGGHNSGLAVGGQLLFQADLFNNLTCVVDKTTKAAAFSYSNAVPGDPNFHSEDMECDTNTFALLGKHVMWSKEAFAPMRAHAFEIPLGTCGIGGQPPEEDNPGFMTGGGSVYTSAGVRVTHGFELHCTATDEPNNLQVNWGKGNRFHLTGLTSASCSDDPAISPEPPAASFDTHRGSGTGKYNGVPGATAEWTITDAGEPGTSDTVTLTVRDAANNVVLTVSGPLNNGNHQAHDG